jgi:hypothetical protein
MTASLSPGTTNGRPWNGFTTAWHLVLIVGLSVAYESLFVGYGVNLIDEAWPLYAVWQLQAGGTLYHEVFFVFPPGHLLPAWIGWLLDPPGLIVARVIYAAFSVALCGAFYFLCRQLMPLRFALLACIALAIAAPNSHLMHVIFGYRYMVFSVLALLVFARRLRSGDSRWMLVAGILLGVGAFFRLGPAFATGCGLGVAVLSIDRDWRGWLRDWSWLALGLLLVFGPLLSWCAATVGIDSLWREIVVRPARMLVEQSLPLPPLEFPREWDRIQIRHWFVALQFRGIWLLYAGYAVGLALLWGRSLLRGQRFEHALLLAVCVFGGVFFSRSVMRSDEPHLDSVIPPVCLLVAHALGRGFDLLWPRSEPEPRPRAVAATALCGLGLLVWIVLLGTDTWLAHSRRGGHPIAALSGRIEVQADHQAALIDRIVRRLRTLPADGMILDMTASPLYALLAQRESYGSNDIVMPATFLTPEEEIAFLERVKRSPPALVIWSKRPFDKDESKAVERTAPRLAAWVLDRYERWGAVRRHFLMGPREGSPPEGW